MGRGAVRSSGGVTVRSQSLGGGRGWRGEIPLLRGVVVAKVVDWLLGGGAGCYGEPILDAGVGAVAMGGACC